MGEVKELAYVKKVVTETADAIIASVKSDMKYKVGTMTTSHPAPYHR